MNWSFIFLAQYENIFLAQYENPEGGSGVAGYHSPNPSEK
jgi:hypothetical protein